MLLLGCMPKRTFEISTRVSKSVYIVYGLLTLKSAWGRLSREIIYWLSMAENRDTFQEMHAYRQY